MNQVNLFVIEPRSAVTQADLENILQLDAQVEALRITRNRIADSVLDRLVAGAPVECGSRTCRLVEVLQAGRRIQRLIVR